MIGRDKYAILRRESMLYALRQDKLHMPSEHAQT
jgi:hypothetical protein